MWTVSRTDGVWYSNDDGAGWTRAVSYPSNGLEMKIQADPSDPASVLVVCGGYGIGNPHILRSEDFGVTWADVTGDFPDQPANTLIVDPARPDDWYAGSDVGVWRSTDGGEHWTPFGSGIANAFIGDLEIRREERKLVAGTYGRGVWEIDLPGASTAVGARAMASRGLMLDPPYPNPVSDKTVFRFAARSPDPAEVNIYNVQGRRVSSVAAGLRGDGVIRLASWSARSLPAGVYYARLQAGKRQISRKVLVVH